MKLKYVRIKNYRSCKDVYIELKGLHSLVGANGSGKSSVLRALDFLFNPANGKIDEESFWNGETTRKIWIEALFENLTPEELGDDKLIPYLKPDRTFHIARSAQFNPVTGDSGTDSSDMKIIISQHYCKPFPSQLWLRQSEINGRNITEWWNNKNELIVDGVSFADLFDGTTKPIVSDWKDKAKSFVEEHLSNEDLSDTWNENPQGYAGVLKGTLPNYVFVPAVRDVVDEAKVTKTNPFGRILYEILDSVTEGQKLEIETSLKKLKQRLNREGGAERLRGIVETETRLNELLEEYMPCDLEIEFTPPTMETVLTNPLIFVNDGFRNIVSNKGHGLQRAVIFSILRYYSECVTGRGKFKKKSMIFAVEEPELYMHPLAQKTIRRVFQNIAKDGDQVIFSTHSAYLVDVAEFDEIIRIEARSSIENGKNVLKSMVWQLPIQKMIDDLKARSPKEEPSERSIRDLYSHAYHPNRSEGFFAKKVILVEGATEQYALPIYADACDLSLDLLNISVVDCGGKGQMDRLYRVFNALGIPCYLIFDYDKDNTDPQIIKKSQSLLTLLEANTSTPEDERIEDNYACFHDKWETSIAGQIDGIEGLTREARKFFGLQADSGKPLIARYIAKKLVSQDPAAVPLIISKMLKKAIKVKWTKSCL